MSAVLTRAGRWVGEHLVLFLGLFTMVYLLLPIFFVVLMSFNDPVGRVCYEFDGFTLDNWKNICDPYGMCSAVRISIVAAGGWWAVASGCTSGRMCRSSRCSTR